jgi:hypothetical protein
VLTFSCSITPAREYKIPFPLYKRGKARMGLIPDDQKQSNEKPPQNTLGEKILKSSHDGRDILVPEFDEIDLSISGVGKPRLSAGVGSVYSPSSKSLDIASEIILWTLVLCSSLEYFWRGQKNPLRPSPLFLGTM